MKLQILLIMCMSLSLRAMEKDASAGVKDSDKVKSVENVSNSEIDEQYAVILGLFDNLKLDQENPVKAVLRCYRCNDYLIFQDEFNVLKNKNILCEKCGKLRATK